MFRTISIVAFVIAFCGIGINCLISPCRRCWSQPLRKLVELFSLLFVEQKLSLASVLRKLVYLLALLCFVVLGVTGFYNRLVLNQPISGYLMMVHATFAPIFAICLAVLAIMWARNCRFSYSDWPWLSRLIQRVMLVKISDEAPSPAGGLGQKVTFWLVIFLALPLILSIVSSMFPLAGTHWQEILLAVHRYTAVAFAVAAIIHTYLMIRSQMKP